MKNKEFASIEYTKAYTDDTGKSIPSLFDQFNSTHFNVKVLWDRTIDAFLSVNTAMHFTCVTGNIRIIIAIKQQTEHENDHFRFKQYYLSEMDGKILNIEPDTWFGVQSLSDKSSFIYAIDDPNPEVTHMSDRIFNWHSKH